jgi:hypothetical protein
MTSSAEMLLDGVELERALALADAIEPRYRALVLVAKGCGLRMGKLLGHTRADIDLLHRRVLVTKQRQELAQTGITIRPPTTEACPTDGQTGDHARPFRVVADDIGQGFRLAQNYLGMRDSARMRLHSPVRVSVTSTIAVSLTRPETPVLAARTTRAVTCESDLPSGLRQPRLPLR